MKKNSQYLRFLAIMIVLIKINQSYKDFKGAPPKTSHRASQNWYVYRRMGTRHFVYAPSSYMRLLHFRIQVKTALNIRIHLTALSYTGKNPAALSYMTILHFCIQV